MLTNKQILKKIKSAKNIAIFAHRHPDPDACGSMFGMQNLCKYLGKTADVFLIKEKEDYLDKIFPIAKAKNIFNSKDFDLVIFVDVRPISSIDQTFQNQLKDHKNILIIDHHQTEKNDDLTNARVVCDASCSQLVLDLFREAEITPDKDTATYLYAGLMGDTNRFLHSNLSKKVFEDAICLQDCGAEIQHVYNYLYRYNTISNIKANEFIINNLKFVSNGMGAFCIVTIKDLKRLNITKEDVKKYCNLMVEIEGVKVSFLCIEEQKNYFKFSLRCATGYNAFKFCKAHGGGGHICASGCEISITKNKLKKMLPIWIEEILSGE